MIICYIFDCTILIWSTFLVQLSSQAEIIWFSMKAFIEILLNTHIVCNMLLSMYVYVCVSVLSVIGILVLGGITWCHVWYHVVDSTIILLGTAYYNCWHFIFSVLLSGFYFIKLFSICIGENIYLYNIYMRSRRKYKMFFFLLNSKCSPPPS